MNVFNKIRIYLLTLNPFIWIGISLLLLGGIFFFSFQTDTPTPSNETTSISSSTSSPLIYPRDKTEKLLEIVQRRKSLDSIDQEIRDELIASLGSSSGILHQTQEYSIEYVKEPDTFMVGIQTINIIPAQQQAVEWLKEKGISSDGICLLPVIFYPSFPKEDIKVDSLLFSPIPEGC